MSCRLQYVMTAVPSFQAAAHENDIAHCINTSQFTDGIYQHHRIGRPFSFHFFQSGTKPGFVTEFTVQPLNIIYTARLTGSHDKPCFGILLAQFSKGR